MKNGGACVVRLRRGGGGGVHQRYTTKAMTTRAAIPRPSVQKKGLVLATCPTKNGGDAQRIKTKAESGVAQNRGRKHECDWGARGVATQRIGTDPPKHPPKETNAAKERATVVVWV